MIVNTPHGKAKVLGYERFDKEGMTAPMSQTRIGDERILCELLPGHTWLHDGVYALYSHEYEELNP